MKILEVKNKVRQAVSLLLMLGLFVPITTVRAGVEEFGGEVSGFTLINAQSDLAISEMANNYVINLDDFSKVNIRADVNDGVESVKFESNFPIDNDSTPNIRTESTAPYASAGDTDGNYFSTWVPAMNVWYVLKATPYSQKSALGLEGISKTVTFMVVDDSKNPVITGVTKGEEYTTAVTPIIEDESSFVAMLNDQPFTSGTPISAHGYYKLTAWDITGKLTSVEFSIKDINAPSAPIQSLPAEGTYLKSSDLIKVDWEDVTDPTLPVTYLFQSSNQPADTEGNFIDPIYTSEWLTLSEIITPNTPEGIYYWHVKAKDGVGNESLWSKEGMFVVDNTAPEVELLPDLLRNKKELVSVVATDNNMTAGLSYSWKSTDEVVFATPNAHETEISATKDGDYEVVVTVTDKAGNKTEKTFTLHWDTTVSSVIDLYAATGSNFVDLHWKNSTETDLVDVKVYRSSNKESLGELLATLKNKEIVYEDNTVLGGVTYYYTVVSRDEAGNNASKQVTVTPELVVASAVSVVAAPEEVKVAPKQANKPEVKEEAKEVKSETSENKNEEPKVKEEKTKIPLFGIVVLVILALVGLYLLYLQYPGFYKKLDVIKKTTKK